MSDYKVFKSLLLLQFLLSKGALEKFEQNTTTQYPNRKEGCFDLISEFCWSETPEGHGYWSSLEKEFYNLTKGATE